jgi:hypothetical protein
MNKGYQVVLLSPAPATFGWQQTAESQVKCNKLSFGHKGGISRRIIGAKELVFLPAAQSLDSQE